MTLIIYNYEHYYSYVMYVIQFLYNYLKKEIHEIERQVNNFNLYI